MWSRRANCAETNFRRWFHQNALDQDSEPSRFWGGSFGWEMEQTWGSPRSFPRGDRARVAHDLRCQGQVPVAVGGNRVERRHRQDAGVYVGDGEWICIAGLSRSREQLLATARHAEFVNAMQCGHAALATTARPPQW